MNILLIEDDAALADVITDHLTTSGYQVTHTVAGDDGLYYAENCNYELIILDIMLPVIDGISILRKLRSNGVNTSILLLTALDTVDDRVAGLDGGADDYLTKPFETKELMARIRALLRRPVAIVGQVISFVDLNLNIDVMTLSGTTTQIQLSKKETLLLELFFRNVDQILTRNVIYNKVWGDDSDADESVIDAYIYMIRKKISDLSNHVKIKTLRSVGYQLKKE